MKRNETKRLTHADLDDELAQSGFKMKEY